MLTRRIGLVALFLTLLVPLVIAPGLVWPFVTGKALAFRWLALVAFGLGAVSTKHWRPLPCALAAVLFLLLPVSMVADALAPNPAFAFWGGFERMDGFIGLVALVMFAAAGWMLLDTAALRRRYLSGMVAISLIVAAIEAAQIAPTYLSRPYSTLGNSDYLGAYMMLMALLAAHLGSTGRRAWWVVAALEVAAVAGTMTLGALIGLTVGLSIVGWVRHRRLFKIMILIVPLIALGSLQFSAVRQSGFVQHISYKLHGPDERPLIWSRTLSVIAIRPVLGWGHEGMTVAPTGIRTSDGSEGALDRAHNLLLDWTVEGGLFGLFAHLVMVAMMWRANRGQPWRQAMIAAWLAQGMFSFDTLTVSMPIYVLMTFI